ncbi:MAG: CpXC domain-containing protein [Pseudomonadota bacterium]
MNVPGEADPVRLACPQCGQAVAMTPCRHVDADREPALRDAILQDTLQRLDCPYCQAALRPEPRLSFADAARGLWVEVFPQDRLGDWRALEPEALDALRQAQGPSAEGAGGAARLVFGWRALREKLLAVDAGLDDVTLEKLKLLLMRDMQEPPLPFGAELRLSEVSIDSLSITVLDRQGQALESLKVPCELLLDITADPDGWAKLDSDLRVGPFVDVQRLIRG